MGKSQDIVEKVRNIVEETCTAESRAYQKSDYTYHIVPVVQRAKELAAATHADKEIVEIAAWLHDIGRIKGDSETHHVSGAEYSEKLLKELGYPLERIEKVKHCIIAHRGSQKIPRETIEAECVASADAMVHFDSVSFLFLVTLVIKKMDVEEAKHYIREKLKRSWNKLMPQAKKIIKPKYEAAMLILG